MFKMGLLWCTSRQILLSKHLERLRDVGIYHIDNSPCNLFISFLGWCAYTPSSQSLERSEISLFPRHRAGRDRAFQQSLLLCVRSRSPFCPPALPPAHHPLHSPNHSHLLNPFHLYLEEPPLHLKAWDKGWRFTCTVWHNVLHRAIHASQFNPRQTTQI